jgi:Domain of unknown function (DUF4266)
MNRKLLKMKQKLIKNAILFASGVIFMSSCVSVKEYQKSRINDSEMELAARKAEKFETSFYLYREGAAGANGGKSGGGCGCN